MGPTSSFWEPQDGTNSSIAKTGRKRSLGRRRFPQGGNGQGRGAEEKKSRISCSQRERREKGIRGGGGVKKRTRSRLRRQDILSEKTPLSGDSTRGEARRKMIWEGMPDCVSRKWENGASRGVGWEKDRLKRGTGSGDMSRAGSRTREIYLKDVNGQAWTPERSGGLILHRKKRVEKGVIPAHFQRGVKLGDSFGEIPNAGLTPTGKSLTVKELRARKSNRMGDLL